MESGAEDQSAIHNRFAVPIPLPACSIPMVQAFAVRPDLDFRVPAADNNLRFVCDHVPVLRDGFHFCDLPGFGRSLQAGLYLFRQRTNFNLFLNLENATIRRDRHVLRMSTGEQLRFEFDLPVLNFFGVAADSCSMSLLVCGLADCDG